MYGGLFVYAVVVLSSLYFINHFHCTSLTPSHQDQDTNQQQDNNMAWVQKTISLPALPRGCHLVTDKILKQVPELSSFKVGLAHFFIQHTSASLTINENYDPTVRKDLEDILNRVVPENGPYRHTTEGPDDMPAHAKASFLGASVSIPITDGSLNLGTWQGIYLCEHRDSGGSRSIVVTVQGLHK